jgi:hypothetical protein
VDPRLNNVMGYIKYGKYIWGEASSESKTAENDSQDGAATNSDKDNAAALNKNDLSEI